MKQSWLLAMLLLTACHHDNPLQTHNKNESATFLMSASANAEKRLQLPIKTGDRGALYLECMEGKQDKNIDCQALYQAMVTFAKEGHYPDFKAVNLSHLTNKNIFASLTDDYVEVLTSDWPSYF